MGVVAEVSDMNWLSSKGSVFLEFKEERGRQYFYQK